MKAKATVIVTDPAGRRVPILAGREVPAWAVPLLDEPAPAPDYRSMTVDALRDEIRERNARRDEEQHLSAQGRKADLIRTLEADDRPNS